MNGEQLIRILLELDQQWLTSRPSPWGEAAELVRTLCIHADPSLRNQSRLGDYGSVDMSQVRRHHAPPLNQPLLTAIMDEEAMTIDDRGYDI